MANGTRQVRVAGGKWRAASAEESVAVKPRLLTLRENAASEQKKSPRPLGEAQVDGIIAEQS